MGSRLARTLSALSDGRRASVRYRALDHALELLVFLALGVAADQPHLFQVVLGHQQVALLGVPHAVIGPGTHVVGVGGERLLVPELGILVAAEQGNLLMAK